METRISREEILQRYRDCRVKLGRAPGIAQFCKTARVPRKDVYYYWPSISKLTIEAGGTPNEFVAAMSDEERFNEFARVCLHLKKIPTVNELRIATRELGTRTFGAYEYYGSTGEFDRRFREWLSTAPEELKSILSFPGWQRTGRAKAQPISAPSFTFQPFLPSGLQFLDALSRGELPPQESSNQSVNYLFESRCADALQALGFEIARLGQGHGRAPDFLATARRFNYGMIVDAKSRREAYVLRTDDRTFFEYVVNFSSRLKSEGVEKTYLAIIASAFRESDLQKLSEYLAGSDIRGITFFSATALMRLVEESIRNRSTFTLGEFEKLLFGNRLLAA